MRFEYYNPVKIDFDVDFEEVLSQLSQKELFNQKCLLITSKGWVKRGIVDRIKTIFGKNISIVLDSIGSNPELGDLQSLKSTMNENYQVVLALGGGSVLDSAKFFALNARVSAENGHLKSIFEDASQLAKPIFALPTTAGTSSELTKWATIWDTQAQIKHSLCFECLYPQRALYDMKLMESLPRESTIHTALDTLSHAVESIWNVNANPISTRYATDCIELILEFLPALCEDLHSLELRRHIAMASVYAGLAFSQTQTALAHAISYPITMRFGVPHGLACSFSLPILLECITDKRAEGVLQPYKKGIVELFARLCVSCHPRDYGLDSVSIDEIFHSLNARAKNALLDLDAIKAKMREM